MAQISVSSSAYSIVFDNGRTLSASIAVAKDEDAPILLSDLALSDDGHSVSASSPFGPVCVSFADAKDGPHEAVTLSAEITLDAPCRKLFLSPLYGMSLENATHLFAHGRTMGGCKTVALPASGPIANADEGDQKAYGFCSYFQTVFSFAEDKLHITQPLRQPTVGNVSGTLDGTTICDIEITTQFDFPLAGRLVTSPSTLAFVTDGFRALCDYGDAQSEAKLPEEPQPIGWNSWDYYRWTITEEETLKNADFIARDPVLSKYVKRIIVDDGWQYCYGEWDANSLFPSGMPALATNLRKMGFTPGLWFAPLVAEPHSRFAQWDADMLGMSEGGDPCLAYSCMQRVGFLLDPTVEKVQKYWYNLFSRYAGYGYGYFKTDFLTCVHSIRRFHDNQVPRGELIRKIIEPIVAGINGRATLLGCSYSYEGGNDMMPMVRTGGDIHATWNCARQNAVSVAARAWASNRLWVTDPDFCVCRGPETSKDPDIGRLQCLNVFVKPEETRRGISPNYPWSFGFDTILAREAQCLLAIAIVNGGAINLSDKLYILNDIGLDFVRRTVAAERGSAGIPLDLFESNVASKWIQRIPSGFRTLLVNWGETEREFRLDYGKLGFSASRARDFWSDEEITIQGDSLHTILAPHTCQFLEFRK